MQIHGITGSNSYIKVTGAKTSNEYQ